jgi:aspartate dehydrogenase
VIGLGLIGYGGVAADMLAALRSADVPATRVVGVLARPGRAEAARARLGEVTIVQSAAALAALRPELVVEAAGHEALAVHGAVLLHGGIDLVIASTGALADAALFERLRAAAAAGRARMLLPAGAIGGIDAIAAMRLRGLSAVRYRSVKPPIAWRGTPAERLLDLDRLAAPTCFYEGSARAAALDYPQNANVAATVALAGLGFEATRVELVADPAAPGNLHEIEAEGASGRIAIRLHGKPSASNPKTSALTALSVARAVVNRAAAIVI